MGGCQGELTLAYEEFALTAERLAVLASWAASQDAPGAVAAGG